MRYLLLLALLLAQPANAEMRGFPEVEALFASGDFEATARKVNDLLAHDAEFPVERRASLYLMKARLELAFNRPGEIRLWLKKAYEAYPELTLDPVKDPPQLVSALTDIRDESRGPPPPVNDEDEGNGYEPLYMPFGIGHFASGRVRDGALFLTSETLALLVTATMPKPADGGDGPERTVFGALSFVGIYGYELYDLLPGMRRHDPDAARSLRYGLSYMPFGVAQAKNHEFGKAGVVAGLQSAFLVVATLAPDSGGRRSALGLFTLAWGYSILDGLAHHEDLATISEEREEGFRWSVMPTANRGIAAQVTVDLP